MTSTRCVFERLAQNTWCRLRDGQHFSIRQGEVALTDYLLLEIARQQLSSVRILKTTAAQEPVRGCDWEWWIGGPNVGWIRYAVQAKRLGVPDDRYRHMRHTVGGKRQVDILLAYAQSQGAVPVYCLYNYTARASARHHWQCGGQVELEQLGCTVVQATRVAHAISTSNRTFDFLHRNCGAVPWRCLVACPTLARTYSSSQGNTATNTASLHVFDERLDVVLHPESPERFAETASRLLVPEQPPERGRVGGPAFLAVVDIEETLDHGPVPVSIACTMT